MARILITGTSGLLGINLAQETMGEHQIFGLDRGRLGHAPFKIIHGDLLDPRIIESAIQTARPEWIINCAALADLDRCEEDPDLARRLNTDAPAKLAKICKARGIALVHISTDAVFDGMTDAFYKEEDEPNPLSVYARTKLDSERAVRAENPDAIVARVNFYGWSLTGKRSLAEFFFHNLTNNKSMSGFTDVKFCPMLVNDTARTLVKMLQKNLKGLYHLAGPQAMSKYQFGVEIARKFNLREAGISPKSINTSSLNARRSNNLCLSINKISTDLGEALPEFSTGLNEFYLQYQHGYPQKIRGYAQ